MPPRIISSRVPRSDVADVLKLIADSRLASEIAATQTRGSIATSLLQDVAALELAARRLDSLGLPEAQFLGAGKESAVLGAGDKVVKIGLGRHGPYQHPDVPGILPYEYSEIVGPLRIGVQERVPFVRPGETGNFIADRAVDRDWRARADRVYDSLLSRGILFQDPHGGNVGQYPDGRLVAIDGPFERIPVPAKRPYVTTEDAIRALLAPLPGQ